MSWAALGQTVDSVASDQQRMEGRMRTTVLQSYTVHEISRDDGTVVNEYVSPAGKVFGVAWQGPTMPNLEQLLGAYFPQFQSASRAAVHRRASIVVRSGDLVIESGGHPRSFRGRAYVGALVPANVSQAVVQ